MKILLLTDIHGNLPALEAVLNTPQARGADRVVSAGDHTGFGPCPRQVTERLLSLGAVLLAGNHEERLPQADTQAFAGYNWSLLRWTRRELAGLALTWPRTLTLGSLLFAHGTPDDANLLMYPEDLPALLAGLPAEIRWYFSGHNHHPWDVSAAGRRAVNPGSLGMLEDGRGGTAPFAVIDVEGERVTCRVYHAQYDPALTRRAYVVGGAAQAAPEMCRAAMYTMETGTYQACLKFVRLARELGESRGLTLADPEAFQLAAAAWDWGDGMSCAEYWRRA